MDQSNGSTALLAEARGRCQAKEFKSYPENHMEVSRIRNREVTTPNSLRKLTLAGISEGWGKKGEEPSGKES